MERGGRGGRDAYQVVDLVIGQVEPRIVEAGRATAHEAVDDGVAEGDVNSHGDSLPTWERKTCVARGASPTL